MSKPCSYRDGRNGVIRQGTRYTYGELEGLWINAGGSRSYAPLMAAIALAESTGCSAEVNAIGACGLWQIHPYVNGCLDGPANARMAVAKLKSQGLDAWQSYTNGSYKQFLHGSVPPVLNVSGSGGGQQATLTADTSGTCLITLPAIKAPVVNITLAGGFCIFSKSNGRAIIGGLVLVGGVLVMGTGLLLLAAYGLKAAGASKPAGRALEIGGAVAGVAGAPVAGAALATAGSRVRSQGASRAATGAATDRARRKAAARKAPQNGEQNGNPAGEQTAGQA
jgi:hypothetical protein